MNEAGGLDFILPQKALHDSDIVETSLTEGAARSVHLLYAGAEGTEDAIRAQTPGCRFHYLQPQRILSGPEAAETLDSPRVQWVGTGLETGCCILKWAIQR